MTTEIRQCQNCKQSFTIEPEDFNFYEKMQVPPPTWCPECRMVRRSIFVTDRTLFKRKDDYTGKEIFSIFPADAPFPVYSHEIWWGDEWDAMSYGTDYTPKQSFWLQFRALLNSVPRYNLVNLNSTRCEYSNASFSKDCYYTIGFEAENCLYGYYCRRVKECADYVFLVDCERCYESTYLKKCNNVSFSHYSEECRDSAFLSDCKNCSNCFGCVGLRNKQFHVFNEPRSEKDYREFLSGHDIGRFSSIEGVKREFQDFSLTFPKKYARIVRSRNSTGDNLKSCNNCLTCFDIDPLTFSSDNCKYIISATATHDCHDLIDTGENSELCYDSTNCWGSRIAFSSLVIQSTNVQYSYNCHNSESLFGCVGLRKKQYCVLNKQYTKEEYEQLVSQIIENMKKVPYLDERRREYRYGEFFPPDFSAMTYNDSLAQRWFPLTKREAIAQGYRWRDPDTRDYKITIKTEDLPDHIKDVPNSITQEIIQCAHTNLTKSDFVRLESTCNEQCTTAFKIIPEELQFYKRMNLPLPRLCPNCRHYQRLKQRNPLKLWYRKCQCAGQKSEKGVYQNTISHQHGTNLCPNEFETSYALDRPEIVYCEQCYNAEVV